MDGQSANTQGEWRQGNREFSPELIREIADKVYLLLVQRLQIERERARLETANDWEW
jgi:hypothetical protein